jgi:hypothetical protein
MNAISNKLINSGVITLRSSATPVDKMWFLLLRKCSGKEMDKYNATANCYRKGIELDLAVREVSLK